MAAMKPEGAVRAPGRVGNPLDWFLSPQDEVTSLVSKEGALIHISQEQEKKMIQKETET